MVNPYRFYTYAYLRVDRTPYYIGKGEGNRAYKKRNNEIRPPKDKSRIIKLKQNLTEQEAFKHEIYMIAVFGRKDLGKGILHNRTNGGEGVSGAIVSQELRRKRSERMKGKNNPRYGKPHSEKTKEKNRQKHLGKSVSEETRKKQSEVNKGKNKGRKWWNDGCGNMKFVKECPGEGWILGMCEETKVKRSIVNKKENNPAYGRKWWNDGDGNRKLSIECPGKGWSLGQDKEHKAKVEKSKVGRKWWNDGDGNTKFVKECPGEGWISGRGRYKN